VKHLLWAIVALAWAGMGPAQAAPAQAGAAPAEEARRLVHMLDYIAVDYPATVRDGRVVDEGEYAEQVEFAGVVQASIRRLAAGADAAGLVADAQALRAAIEARAPPERVAALSRSLRGALVRAFQVRLAPRSAPDLAGASRLYAEQCASCHGPDGRGDGPAARGLDPAPTDFTDRARAEVRSVFGLYNTITLGVADTAMRGFATLPDRERWALAFHVGSLAFTEAERARGRALWTSDPAWRERFPDLAAVSAAVPAEVAEHHGADGVAVLAYLRAHPEALGGGGADPFTLAGERLDESLALYRKGDAAAAYQAALSAYLDGFELAEARVAAARPELRSGVERAMLAYREALRRHAPVEEVARLHAEARARLEAARAAVEESGLDGPVAFASALIILLREGLEAILILAVIGATLVKAGRRDALPWLHAGWIAALALGAATWAVSAYMVSISGAGRELTEGVTALLAAGVLLYVGFWLHGKTHADRWQRFLKEKIHDALHGGALWALAFTAFLAVYREVFETILFYQALWLQAGPAAVGYLWGGIATAVALLAVLTWLILRYSLRLPLRLFFNVNAALLFALAVMFTGHGIAALQEAGRLPARTLPLPEIDILGIYPTVETLAAQAAVLLLGAAWLLWERRARGAAAAS